LPANEHRRPHAFQITADAVSVTPARGRLRRFAVTGLKLAVSLLLIGFALRGVDSTTVVAQLRQVEAGPVVLALALTISIAGLQARRWEIVLSRMTHDVPYLEALKLVLIGYFFNQTLPSTVGGDAYRAWGAYRLGISPGEAISSVIVDRAFALVSLVVMIAAGLWWLFDIVRAPGARWLVLLVIFGGLASMGILLSLAKLAPRLQRWRASRLLLEISRGALAVSSSSNGLLQVVLLTLAGYAAFSYAVYVLAIGLSVPLGLGHAMLFVPLVTLVTVLPISIAGWGLRESSMVVALGLVGVPSAQAFSLSVLSGLVVAASGIPGAVLWLWRKRKPSPPIPPDPREAL
jgi:glycosyltransferase 2 family protein